MLILNPKSDYQEVYCLDIGSYKLFVTEYKTMYEDKQQRPKIDVLIIHCYFQRSMKTRYIGLFLYFFVRRTELNNSKLLFI